MPVNVIGTDASQTFSVNGSDLSSGVIDGGGGTDVLELRDFFYPQTFDFTNLTTFKNVEIIRGVIEVANIRIRADQLADVTTIDSNGIEHLDQVSIVGTSINLSDKILLGRLEIRPETANAEIKVADFAMASLIRSTVRGVAVQVASGTLTQQQRVALYNQGIDKITDANGQTTETLGPVLTSLQGDVVSYVKGAKIHIDAGGNATLTAEGHLKTMVVDIKGESGLFHTLDLDVGGRLKIQGKNADGDNRIFVDNVEIGAGFRLLTDGSLHFTFNENATANHVQEVIRSITYQYDVFSPSAGSLGVELTLSDVGGRVVKTTSTIRIEGASSPEPTNPGMSVIGTAIGEVLNGSTGNDIIKGLQGKDVLKGSAGRDKLYGGEGKDTLTGGSGKDVFVFDTKLNKRINVDKIADFSVKDDSIWLENKIFKKLGKKGSEKKPAKLNKKFFTVDAKAKEKEKDDYIVYNKKKGVLYYDADGFGSKKAVEFAQLKKNLKLTYKDFFVV